MAHSTDISPRFEIRPLGPEHIEWAKAIITHSNIFHSPVWSNVHPVDKTKRAYDCFNACDYLVHYQVNSGLTYGVFDKEYKFKRPESESKAGALYWDQSNLSATPEQLLEEMDFPLASIALSQDEANAMDVTQLFPLFGVLPLFATTHHKLSELDTRDPASWEPKASGEVLARNGTSTRADYEGHGLMKKMSLWLMREAADKGFRGIKIEAFHDAVHHVWTHPLEPYKATVVSIINLNDMEEERDGKMVKPYTAFDQLLSKLYITLR
jgi:hypothetical protein